LNILFIDDDATILEVAPILFEFSAHNLVAKSCGADGIEAFKQQDFDLVITDLRMPGLDGFAVLEAVKRLKPDVKVIAMSGDEIDPGEGFDGVELKPIMDFLAMVEKYNVAA